MSDLMNILDEIQATRPEPAKPGRKPRKSVPDQRVHEGRANYCPHCNTYLSVKYVLPAVVHVMVSFEIRTKLVGDGGKVCLYCHVEENQ
jgi:hypothetical protein